MKYFLIVFLLAAAFLVVRAKVHKLGTASGDQTMTSTQVMTSAQVLQVSANSKEKALLVFLQPQRSSGERMEPMIQQVEQANPNLQVIRINTRLPENRQIHDEYGVRGTPALVILQNGRTVGRDNGPFLNKQDFLGFLRTNKSPYNR